MAFEFTSEPRQKPQLTSSNWPWLLGRFAHEFKATVLFYGAGIIPTYTICNEYSKGRDIRQYQRRNKKQQWLVRIESSDRFRMVYYRTDRQTDRLITLRSVASYQVGC